MSEHAGHASLGNDHERARQLIDRQAVEGLEPSEREWLESHVEACRECAVRQSATAGAIASIKAFGPLPSPALVAGTRLRVLSRAAELRRIAAVQRPLWIACVFSFAWMLISTPYFWRGFAWLGKAMSLPAVVWQAGFVMTWFLPATIAGAILAWRELRRSAPVAGHAESEMHVL